MVYNRGSMPTDAHIEETAKDDGTVAETLHIEFTNGSLEQLRTLSDFFDVKDKNPSEVVTLGISFLQNLKEKYEKENKKPDINDL